MLNTVKVPKQFEPLFEKAQEYVSKYFDQKKFDPTKGTIEIFGQRYVLARAASLSVDFFEAVRNLYKDAGEDQANNVARSLLYDLAHAIGKMDAKNFAMQMSLKEPVAKLSAGPVHFAFTGWAFVDIFPESKPSPDENYYLIYDHPFSFESDAWKKSGKKSDFPVCVMNAGYSSGWCEESFGIPLVAAEILCKAKGDDACRFIMAHPSKIEGYIKEYLKKEPKLAKRVTKYEIPGFFKRKEMEEALKASEEKFRFIFDAVNDGMVLAEVEAKKFVAANKKIAEMLGYSVEEIGNLGVADIHPKEKLPEVFEKFDKLARGEITRAVDLPVQRKDKSVFYAEVTAATIKLHGKPYMIGVFRDITDRQKAEAELAKKVQELEIFYKAAMGREDKILELKKRIAELEGKTS